MALHAYIDDSYTTDDGPYVLAGFISTPARWAEFSRAWSDALPKWGRLDKYGNYHFKMAEMAAAGAMEKVAGLYRIIEDNVQLGISCSFHRRDLQRAKARIVVPGRPIDWAYLNNMFIVGYHILMDGFHDNRQGPLERFAPLGEKIDFHFDEQLHEGKNIVAEWDEYIRQRPDKTKDLYGAKPIFANDKQLLPLQAADFYAWWVRKWTIDDPVGTPISKLDFGSWKADPYKFPRAHISFTEEQLVNALLAELRRLDPAINVYDGGRST